MRIKKAGFFGTILLGMISMFSMVETYAVEEETELYQKTEDLADYILNNLAAMVDAYNSECDDEASVWNAQNCEFQKKILSLDTMESLSYFDFDADNGYMVVSETAIVSIHTQGDFGDIRSYNGEIFYSGIDDAFYYYEDDEYKPFKRETDNEEIISADSYQGTKNGTIVSAAKYVYDRYGSCEVYDVKYLNSSYLQASVEQMGMSVYTKTIDGMQFSEGNCMLVAIYNALIYLKKANILTALPAETVTTTVNPTKDPFYALALNNGYEVTHTELPRLYYKIRAVAIASYGYTTSNSSKPDGTSNSKSIGGSDVERFLSSIGSFYKTSIKTTKKTGSMSVFKSAIGTDKKPVIWELNDSTYGSHAVVVTGYIVYKQYKTILGVSVCTKTINILRIMNGWSTSTIYYDLRSTSGTAHVFS